jgi:hypothetical protein
MRHALIASGELLQIIDVMDREKCNTHFGKTWRENLRQSG